MFAYMGSFKFDLITSIDSLTVIPLAAKNVELDTTTSAARLQNHRAECLDIINYS